MTAPTWLSPAGLDLLDELLGVWCGPYALDGPLPAVPGAVNGGVRLLVKADGTRVAADHQQLLAALLNAAPELVAMARRRRPAREAAA